MVQVDQVDLKDQVGLVHHMVLVVQKVQGVLVDQEVQMDLVDREAQ